MSGSTGIEQLLGQASSPAPSCPRRWGPRKMKEAGRLLGRKCPPGCGGWPRPPASTASSWPMIRSFRRSLQVARAAQLALPRSCWPGIPVHSSMTSGQVRPWSPARSAALVPASQSPPPRGSSSARELGQALVSPPRVSSAAASGAPARQSLRLAAVQLSQLGETPCCADSAQEQASSSRSMALSGRNRSVMYRSRQDHRAGGQSHRRS